MSVGVDLDNLDPAQLVQDDGSALYNPPADLTNTLPNAQFGQSDQGPALISLAPDLDDLGARTLGFQDLGLAFTQNGMFDTNAILSTPLEAQDTTDAWWQMTGFDTVASAKITWTGRTPLTPPPTQHPVTGISAVRLTAFLPQSNGQ